MEISGVRTVKENITLEVSDSEVRHIIHQSDLPYSVYMSKVRSKFLKSCGLSSDASLNGDKWVVERENHTGHYWTYDETVRKATEDEIKFMDELRAFEEFLLMQELK